MFEPVKPFNNKNTIFNHAISDAILKSLLNRINIVKNAGQIVKLEEAEDIADNYYPHMKNCMIHDHIEELEETFRDVFSVDLNKPTSNQRNYGTSKKRMLPSNKVEVLKKKKFLIDQQLEKEKTGGFDTYRKVHELTIESEKLKLEIQEETEKKKQQLSREKEQNQNKTEKILSLQDKYPNEFKFYTSKDLIKASCEYLTGSDLLPKIPQLTQAMQFNNITIEGLQEVIKTVASIIPGLATNNKVTAIPKSSYQLPLGIISKQLRLEKLSLESLWKKTLDTLKEESQSGRAETRGIEMACFSQAMSIILHKDLLRNLIVMLREHNKVYSDQKDKAHTSPSLTLS